MPKKKTAAKAAPQRAKFLRFNAIKEYINDNLKMRSSDKAVKKFIKEFDYAIGATLKEAKKSAREDKRNTIMDQDIIPALEKHLGKKHLTWQETVNEIIRQNPADLGKISKAVNDYIEKGQGK
jgi:histone H3/H4